MRPLLRPLPRARAGRGPAATLSSFLHLPAARFTAAATSLLMLLALFTLVPLPGDLTPRAEAANGGGYTNTPNKTSIVGINNFQVLMLPGDTVTFTVTVVKRHNDKSVAAKDSQILLAHRGGGTVARKRIDGNTPVGRTFSINGSSSTRGVWGARLMTPGHSDSDDNVDNSRFFEAFRWDITVRNSAGKIRPGRVWTYRYGIWNADGTNVKGTPWVKLNPKDATDMRLWFYNHETSHLYNATYNGYNGVYSKIRVTSDGLWNTKTGNKVSRSIGVAHPDVTDATGRNAFYAIFFEPPDRAALSAGPLNVTWNGLQHHFDFNPTSPAITEAEWVPDHRYPNRQAGWVRFRATNYTGPVSVRFRLGVEPGTHDDTVKTAYVQPRSWQYDPKTGQWQKPPKTQVYWNGVNIYGNDVSPSKKVPILIRTGQAGEIHFVNVDVEQLDGLQVTLLNPVGGGQRAMPVYWDDRPLSVNSKNTVATRRKDGRAGVPSGSAPGVHNLPLGKNNYSNGWGNERRINDWTYSNEFGTAVTSAPAQASDLAIVKSILTPNPGLLGAGDTIRWRVTVRNDGTKPATSSTLTDVIPTQVDAATASMVNRSKSTGSLTKSGRKLTWSNINQINPGETISVEVTGVLRAGATGRVVNSAAITSPDDKLGSGVGPDDGLKCQDNATLAQDTDKCDRVAFTLPGPSLQVHKELVDPSAEDGEPAKIGDTVLWQITVANTTTSGAQATNVVVRDTEDPALGNPEFTSLSKGSVDAGDDRQWNIGTLAAGEVATALVSTTVTEAPGGAAEGMLTNRTVAWADGLAVDPALRTGVGVDGCDYNEGLADDIDQCDFAQVPFTATADLGVTKAINAAASDDLTKLARGSLLVWDVTVTNTGTKDARDVVVTDHTPSNVDPASVKLYNPSRGTVATDGTLRWLVGTLPVGGTATLRVSGRVDAAPVDPADDPDWDKAVNIVTVDSPDDPFLGSLDECTDGCAIHRQPLGDPNLKVDTTTEDINTSSPFGNTVDFSVTVKNASALWARDVTVRAALPNLSVATSPELITEPPAGEFDLTTGNWTGLGDLAPGQQHTLTFRLQVPSADLAAGITNAVQATATEYGGEAGYPGSGDPNDDVDADTDRWDAASAKADQPAPPPPVTCAPGNPDGTSPAMKRFYALYGNHPSGRDVANLVRPCLGNAALTKGEAYALLGLVVGGTPNPNLISGFRDLTGSPQLASGPVPVATLTPLLSAALSSGAPVVGDLSCPDARVRQEAGEHAGVCFNGGEALTRAETAELISWLNLGAETGTSRLNAQVTPGRITTRTGVPVPFNLTVTVPDWYTGGSTVAVSWDEQNNRYATIECPAPSVTPNSDGTGRLSCTVTGLRTTPPAGVPLTATLTDSYGSTAHASFTLVTTNQPPSMDVTATGTLTEGETGTAWTVTLSDPDDDPLFIGVRSCLPSREGAGVCVSGGEEFPRNGNKQRTATADTNPDDFTTSAATDLGSVRVVRTGPGQAHVTLTPYDANNNGAVDAVIQVCDTAWNCLTERVHTTITPVADAPEPYTLTTATISGPEGVEITLGGRDDADTSQPGFNPNPALTGYRLCTVPSQVNVAFKRPDGTLVPASAGSVHPDATLVVTPKDAQPADYVSFGYQVRDAGHPIAQWSGPADCSSGVGQIRVKLATVTTNPLEEVTVTANADTTVSHTGVTTLTVTGAGPDSDIAVRVQWGDGTETSWLSNETISHTYTNLTNRDFTISWQATRGSETTSWKTLTVTSLTNWIDEPTFESNVDSTTPPVGWAPLPGGSGEFPPPTPKWTAQHRHSGSWALGLPPMPAGAPSQYAGALLSMARLAAGVPDGTVGTLTAWVYVPRPMQLLVTNPGGNSSVADLSAGWQQAQFSVTSSNRHMDELALHFTGCQAADTWCAVIDDVSFTTTTNPLPVADVYQRAVLADDPAMYLPLDEVDTTDGPRSRRLRDGTVLDLLGGVGRTATSPVRAHTGFAAARFADNGARVNTGDTARWWVGTAAPRTIEFWTRPAAAGISGVEDRAAWKLGPVQFEESADGSSLQLRYDGFSAAGTTYAGGSARFDGWAAYRDGQPHLITVVTDPVLSDNLALYIDGNPASFSFRDANDAAGGTWKDVASPGLTVGRTAAGNQWRWPMSDFAVYDTTMSPGMLDRHVRLGNGNETAAAASAPVVTYTSSAATTDKLHRTMAAAASPASAAAAAPGWMTSMAGLLQMTTTVALTAEAVADSDRALVPAVPTGPASRVKAGSAQTSTIVTRFTEKLPDGPLWRDGRMAARLEKDVLRLTAPARMWTFELPKKRAAVTVNELVVSHRRAGAPMVFLNGVRVEMTSTKARLNATANTPARAAGGRTVARWHQVVKADAGLVASGAQVLGYASAMRPLSVQAHFTDTVDDAAQARQATKELAKAKKKLRDAQASKDARDTKPGKKTSEDTSKNPTKKAAAKKAPLVRKFPRPAVPDGAVTGAPAPDWAELGIPNPYADNDVHEPGATSR